MKFVVFLLMLALGCLLQAYAESFRDNPKILKEYQDGQRQGIFVGKRPETLKEDTIAPLARLHIIVVDEDGHPLFPFIYSKDSSKQDPDAPFKAKKYSIGLRKFRGERALRCSKENTEFKHCEVNLTYKAYCKQIIDAIHEAYANSPEPENFRVVLHSHGGMNDIRKAIQRAVNIHRSMEHRNENLYPIIICWDSHPVTTYFDHVAASRSGNSVAVVDREEYGAVTAPFVLLGDLGQSIVRAPEYLALQFYNDFVSNAGEIAGVTDINKSNAEVKLQVFDRKDALDDNDPARLKFVHPDNARVSSSDATTAEFNGDERAMGERVEGYATYWLGLPFKVATGSFIHAFGPRMWSEMKRRVDMMFWKEHDYLTDQDGLDAIQTDLYDDEILSLHTEDRISPAPTHRGAVRRFFEQLEHEIHGPLPQKGSPQELAQKITDMSEQIKELTKGGNSNYKLDSDSLSELELAGKNLMSAESLITSRLPSKPSKYENYKIVAIGHSMGAMVMNRIIEVADRLNYEKIVYFAAACSVKEFRQSVVPYLEENPDSHFYNLCLHPIAERKEQNFFHLVPRGSLLVWIDSFFENPTSEIEKRYGQSVTSVNTVPILPNSIRDQVTIKWFGVGKKGEMPQMHSHFNNYGACKDEEKHNPYLFWEPKFWGDSVNLYAPNENDSKCKRTQRKFDANGRWSSK